jgi:predicted transposase/invertase (TIGR01784 family)
MEIIVIIYNINYARNFALMEKCQSLKEYSIFIEKVREYVNVGLELEEAFKKAREYCIDNNVMEEYLRKYGKEMYDMINMEWDINIAKKVWHKEGVEEGLVKGKMETALNMLKENFSLEMVARMTNLSVETIRELAVQNKLI